MHTVLDCPLCQFHFQVEISEPFTDEQPTDCPNCGSRFRITSIEPLYYVCDLDCRVRLSALETRQLSEKQQQELDDQAQQVDGKRVFAIVQHVLSALDARSGDTSPEENYE